MDTADTTSVTPDRVGRTRAWSVRALTVLTALALTLTTTALWVHRTAFDTDAFMALVEPTVAGDEVVTVLSARLTESTLEVLAIDERFDEILSRLQRSLTDALSDALGLPPRSAGAVGAALEDRGLALLAVPLASAVEERVATAVDDIVTSEELQAVAVEMIRTAHRQAVLLVRGDVDQLPAVVVADGVVALDLRPLVGRVLTELRPDILDSIGLPAVIQPDDRDEPLTVLEVVARATGAELDPSFGRVPILDESELVELQLLVRTMDRAVWGMVVATLLLAIACVGLAVDRRRAARDLGIATVVGLTLAILLIGRLVDRLVALGTTPAEQAAILDVAATTVGSLRGQFVIVLALAAVVAVASHLGARRPRPAQVTAG